MPNPDVEKVHELVDRLNRDQANAERETTVTTDKEEK